MPAAIFFLLQLLQLRFLELDFNSFVKNVKKIILQRVPQTQFQNRLLHQNHFL
jgi:hypothetical protein